MTGMSLCIADMVRCRPEMISRTPRSARCVQEMFQCTRAMTAYA